MTLANRLMIEAVRNVCQVAPQASIRYPDGLVLRSAIVRSDFSQLFEGQTVMHGSPNRVDRVLINGRILTVDPAFTQVEALALRDGRVVASGTTAEIRALAGPDTRSD